MRHFVYNLIIEFYSFVSFQQQGNQLFKEGKYEAAINRYTLAVNLHQTNPILYANRAMALIKTDKYVLFYNFAIIHEVVWNILIFFYFFKENLRIFFYYGNLIKILCVSLNVCV